MFASSELQEAVKFGMKQTEDHGKPFMWLCCTNRGAADVCRAALHEKGITDQELETGYLGDPNAKSPLHILARPGLLLRLTRNWDKQRGFVNGALGIVHEVFEGNEIFSVKLLESGNVVLVHPMLEKDQIFLPCCYGYATTIRRAQGASLFHGCVYFDQKKFAAGRGYAYVAISRFRTRLGVYLYGKVRRSDFLPVGNSKSEEQDTRGYLSESSNDNCERGIELAGQNIFNAEFQDEDDESVEDIMEERLGDAESEASEGDTGMDNSFYVHPEDEEDDMFESIRMDSIFNDEYGSAEVDAGIEAEVESMCMDGVFNDGSGPDEGGGYMDVDFV
jgi:hypothetical protein